MENRLGRTELEGERVRAKGVRGKTDKGGMRKRENR